MPFADFRPDEPGRIELADIERGFDDGVEGEARRNRLEIRDFPGRAATDHSVSSSSSGQQGARCSTLYGTERSGRYVYRVDEERPRLPQRENPGGGSPGFSEVDDQHWGIRSP